MTDKPIFDIRKSVARRTVTRTIVGFAIAIASIWFGLRLMPDSIVLDPDVLFDEDSLIVPGAFVLGFGVFRLIKEILFALRSLGLSGEWHFRLTRNELLWDVPRHAHGPETGFKVLLSEIREIEFRRITSDEGWDEKEYWIYFRNREPIQLKGYSGIRLSPLVLHIREAGVSYSETVVKS